MEALVAHSSLYSFFTVANVARSHSPKHYADGKKAEEKNGFASGALYCDKTQLVLPGCVLWTCVSPFVATVDGK